VNTNKILDSFDTLPPGDIYLIAPKAFIERGFSYYSQARLKQFQWTDGCCALLAKVRGTRTYTVSIHLDDGYLKYNCSCPAWSPGSNCKHVVCAVVTIKNLLNENHFQDHRISGQYRALLKRSLLDADHAVKNNKKEEKKKNKKTGKRPGYSILLDKPDFPWMSSAKVYRGEMEVLHNKAGLPKALAPLIGGGSSYGYYSYYSTKDALPDYLKAHGNRYPLFLKMKDGNIPVTWDENLLLKVKTELDVSGDEVTARVAYVHDESPIPLACLFNDSIVIDIRKSRIGFLENGDGWNMWRATAEILEAGWADGPGDFEHTDECIRVVDDNETDENIVNRYLEMADADEMPLKIPLKLFNSLRLQLTGKSEVWLEHFNYTVEGKPAMPENTDYSCRMMIDPVDNNDSKVVLRALIDFNGITIPTAGSFFKILPMMENGGNNFSSAMRAKKRRNVMIDTFIKLLACRTKKEFDKIVKKALSNGDYRKTKIRSEAKRLLGYAYNSLATGSSQLFFHNGRWLVIERDRIRESRLYAIPYEIFGIDLFRDMKDHSEMNLEADQLFASFFTLYEKLKAHNIHLYFKGKPVTGTSWDFTFDAAKSSGIDWFEIKPEILSDGKLVNEEMWQNALSRKGIVESGEEIQILDSNTKEVLGAIDKIRRNEKVKDNEKEIVRVPRLQILDWVELRKKAVKVKLADEDEKLLEGLTSFKKINKKALPEKLNATLRPYQKDGYNWLAFLYEHRFGACLADDMGLGKTLQAIALLAAVKEGIVKPHGGKIKAPHLIVLPPSLLFNWQNEIERFYPSLKVYGYIGKERKLPSKSFDVILTTYGLVRRDIEKLEEFKFNVIIFDEAQAVKNIYASTTGAVRRLQGYFKLTVTGTPLENHLGEYYSSLDLALPGLLGEYDDFSKFLKADSSSDLDVIIRRTRPFVLRRTKEKVLTELPEKTENDVYLDLTDRQKALYKKTVNMIKSTIDNAYQSKTSAQAQIIALTAILKLRQLCVSPRLIDRSLTERSPKMEFLCLKINELIDEGHSALVFSQFTSFLDILEEELLKEGVHYLRLDGSTPTAKRKKLVESFQNGKSPSVFLLSLKAGGQGLNLTRASYVFHLDPWWNPAVENQASDRAHRLGQKNKVTITRILMHHTVEEKMMTLKKKKLALFNTIMDDSKRSKKGFSVSKADFEFLLAT